MSFTPGVSEPGRPGGGGSFPQPPQSTRQRQPPSQRSGGPVGRRSTASPGPARSRRGGRPGTARVTLHPATCGFWQRRPSLATPPANGCPKPGAERRRGVGEPSRASAPGPAPPPAAAAPATATNLSDPTRPAPPLARGGPCTPAALRKRAPPPPPRRRQPRASPLFHAFSGLTPVRPRWARPASPLAGGPRRSPEAVMLGR